MTKGTPEAPLHRKKVAVIGAGVSGLAAAKCLLDEGIEPVVLEQSVEIGGVWTFHEEAPDGGSYAYRSLHTNTSKQTTGFSDFPFPASAPDFPSRAEVLDYLNSYAAHFGLSKFIRLSTSVEEVSPSDNLPQNGSNTPGSWRISYRAEGAAEAESDAFDAVLVCSGLYRTPAMPVYPGADKYQGEIIHSKSYKGPEGFEAKDVVVVGTGSSGADIAAEVSKVAAHTNLSAARPTWFMPRYIGGKPYDHHLTRLAAHVPYHLRMRVFQRLLFGEYSRMGISDPREALGIAMPAEPLDILTRRVTPGMEIIRRIASGAVTPRLGVAGLEGREVIFTDGTRTHADTIILATGYNMRFPFLPEPLARPQGNMVDLYKHVFHPELPGLAFIGLCRAAGPVIPLNEMQARWAARVLSGGAALPASSQMRAEIQTRRTSAESAGRYPLQVEVLEYMDELAAEIGAKPGLTRHPAIAWQLLSGTPVAAQYRLQGPGSWKEAEQAVRAANRYPSKRPGESNKL